MPTNATDQLSDPLIRWRSRSGRLEVSLNANGSLHRLQSQGLNVNLFPGTELEGGPTQIVMRRHHRDGRVDAVPLLGPRALGSAWHGDRRGGVRGEAFGVRYHVELVLDDAETAWFWHVEVENLKQEPARLDLIFLHDVALAPFGSIRLNEAYVSQYIDHQPLDHPRHGWVVATRQNAAVEGRTPWLLTGSLARAISYATDALQTEGLETRAGASPAAWRKGLPRQRLQHEHSQVSLQDGEFDLAPGRIERRGFFAYLQGDHPQRSSADDLEVVDRAMALASRRAPPAREYLPLARSDNLFSQAPLLETQEPVGSDWADVFDVKERESMRLVERSESGALLSFFTAADRHIVLAAKERRVLRPHGLIMRTGAHWTPDEASLASTVWMAGVFHSSLTQGHASANRMLSTQRGYLSLFRAQGLRLFVDAGEGWRLLDVPSAMEMTAHCARWFYRHAHGSLVVKATASLSKPCVDLKVEVLQGAPLRVLATLHIAMNEDDGLGAQALPWTEGDGVVQVRPAPGSHMQARFADGALRITADEGTRWSRVGNDALLFADGRSRGQPYLCLQFDAVQRAAIGLHGQLLPAQLRVQRSEARAFLMDTTGGLTMNAPAPAPREFGLGVEQLSAFVPWLAQNALVHYLAPRGLEQFSGGGWGTRDVSQGPLEWLLALGRNEPIRDLIVRVFCAQNADGDWPQWFMFFARDAQVRAGDSHGDVVFWPLVALAQYLVASGDASILEHAVPFHGSEEALPISEHVERAFAVIARRMIAQTQLVSYGHGDWNDALQPADPAMRDRLCSSWTVTLHYRMLTLMAAGYERIGRGDRAAGLHAQAAQVLADFQRVLVVDGQVAGYASFENADRVDYLLHRRDERTGIRFSALPMVHAIVDELFSKEQAHAHLALIREHLWGPDGLRLFDRPLRYSGGLQKLFQRGESASYFGREIGLMYMHLHLRFAEALAHLGRAEEFFEALRLADPIGISSLVPSAALRQSNCYYSSSDAAFADRDEASRDYARIGRGDVALEGGWRVYSSGAGIAFRLVMQNLLGLTQQHDRLIVDPVMPAQLDGLRAQLLLYGRECEVVYRVGERGFGATRVSANGRDMALTELPNRYRLGGVCVGSRALLALLRPRRNLIEIDLGA